MKQFILFFLSITVFVGTAIAQNPIVRDQFSADPSARIFNGKMYVFPSHDILIPPNKNLRKNWFCMADYHVFSSENLTDWTDHGVIVSQDDVPWVDSTSYSMWAPDCIERNGKYYFYFPANTRHVDLNGRREFGIGVAVADKPEGPYAPMGNAIEGVRGIDPNVFMDKDGQAYLFFSMGNIYVAKLKENMVELDSEPVAIANLPEKGLKEGPYLIERYGIYYLTFPHVENNIERLEYAIGDNPLGPFKMAGVIMDESPMKCWTNHLSLIEKNQQWYLLYHQNAYSPDFDKNRSICMDSIFFNSDGTIQKVIPSHRGVGITLASSEIQIDRFSTKSEGVEVSFMDTANTFAGWKAILSANGDWIQYNVVQFLGSEKAVTLKYKSLEGGDVLLSLQGQAETHSSNLKLPPDIEWQEVTIDLAFDSKSKQNIKLSLKTDNPVEIDWIRFEDQKEQLKR